ncbi:MAG TPA: translational GTPase TypA [Aquificales bacterium]|nr:translational GTPase TypA [Aquificales bacterium]HIO41725.1 translational GTPase TypA [Aquifex sp.]
MKDYDIRNIAIIAHVDHGKTTLVDNMLKQSGLFRENQEVGELILDNLDLERERGITIMAKIASVWYGNTKINIVDTPGHSDFSAEVERVLRMVDGALLLVDAAEGPMPQTRFVLKKALEQGLKPIIVINKIDKANARPEEVVEEVYDLLLELGEDESLLEVPVLYAIGREGIAKYSLEEESKDLRPLFETIVKHVPPPRALRDDTTQLLVSSLDYDPYVGRLTIGKIFSGSLKKGQDVVLLKKDGTTVRGKVQKLFVYEGIGRKEVEEAKTGEIVAFAGFDNAEIGDTVSIPENPVALPPIEVEEPTISMVFSVNKSPFAGREGKFVTSRHLKERLEKETLTNLAIRVEPTDSTEAFKVSGRGELQLAILIEQMRREGYEFEVSKPKVITKEENGKIYEPIEEVVMDIPETYSGAIIEALGKRKGVMKDMVPLEGGRVKLVFEVPTRGLIGFNQEFMTITKGEGIMNKSFLRWDEWQGEIRYRQNGALVSDREGKVTAYALKGLEDRGVFFVEPGTEVYRGMIVGEHNRDKDLWVNVCRQKKLTNIRAAAADEAVKIDAPRKMNLEQCLEFINDDELVEVTPQNIRMRKKNLNPS